jgi:DNA-binding beta-propeller fold protein YncE
VITADGKTAYVTDDGTGMQPGRTVTPIHIATNKPRAAIKVGFSPVDIALTP